MSGAAGSIGPEASDSNRVGRRGSTAGAEGSARSTRDPK